jgi:hypothetical protein
MTGQSELFPQSNEFIPTTKVVELLFALLNLQVESKVLVVEFGFQASSLVSSEGHKVIQIRNSEGLAEQISKIEANSPYDGAIILPSFSGVQANIQPPEGWTNVRRVTTEDSILGHAINSLQPNGSLTALVPNGLLSNYGRQAMRKGLVERGLKLVAKIPYYLLFQDYKDVL